MTKGHYIVSICVPVYKVEDYIERCAVSLFEQTYEDIEYVFVNDCTPDRSWEVLNRVVLKYPNRIPSVKRLAHEINKGIASTRNTAIEHATGNFVLWVDSDDYLDVDFVKQVVEIQAKTSADIVTMNAVHEYAGYRVEWYYKDYSSPREMIIQNLSKEITHNIWGRLIRRSLYVDNNIRCKEGLNIGEDFQMLIALIFYSDKVVTDKSNIYYHYNRANESSYMFDFSLDKAHASFESYMTVVEFLLNHDYRCFFEAVQNGKVKLISSQIVRLCSSKIYDKDYFCFLRSQLQSVKLKYWLCIEPAKQLMLLIRNYNFAIKYVRFMKIIKHLVKK